MRLTLAKQVNQSRSTFAARFKCLAGEAPLQYLTRWRMYCAAKLLRSGNYTVSDIAQQVGYESEAAFSKAFKRQTGQSPSQYRQNASSMSSVAAHPAIAEQAL